MAVNFRIGFNENVGHFDQMSYVLINVFVNTVSVLLEIKMPRLKINVQDICTDHHDHWTQQEHWNYESLFLINLIEKYSPIDHLPMRV